MEGSLDEAIVAYDRAIAFDATNSYFHDGRGTTLTLLGRPGPERGGQDLGWSNPLAPQGSRWGARQVRPHQQQNRRV